MGGFFISTSMESILIDNRYNTVPPCYHDKSRSLSLAMYPKPQKCSVKDCNEIGDRHHPDYEHPENVIWLCHKHHMEQHRREWEAMRLAFAEDQTIYYPDRDYSLNYSES